MPSHASSQRASASRTKRTCCVHRPVERIALIPCASHTSRFTASHRTHSRRLAPRTERCRQRQVDRTPHDALHSSKSSSVQNANPHCCHASARGRRGGGQRGVPRRPVRRAPQLRTGRHRHRQLPRRAGTPGRVHCAGCAQVGRAWLAARGLPRRRDGARVDQRQLQAVLLGRHLVRHLLLLQRDVRALGTQR